MVKRLLFNSKKGLSTIVITIILIALSMAAMVLVWAFVSNMLKKQIKSGESCFGNFDKVEINPQYTCYSQSAGEYTLRFSLVIGNVAVDKVIVSVSSASAVKSYEITNAEQTIPGLTMHPSGYAKIILPQKNSGLTYSATGFTSKIDSVKIAPVIDGTLCEVSDSLQEIEECV